MARLDLGLTANEFHRLPGKKLRALLKRQGERIRREDWRFAFLAAVVINALGGSKEPVQPEDLMPWLAQKREMSPEAMIQFLKGKTKNHGD